MVVGTRGKWPLRFVGLAGTPDCIEVLHATPPRPCMTKLYFPLLIIIE